MKQSIRTKVMKVNDEVLYKPTSFSKYSKGIVTKVMHDRFYVNFNGEEFVFTNDKYYNFTFANSCEYFVENCIDT